MQLFTIGLYELELDGSPQLDAAGAPIPTYGTEHIAEFAKCWTGFDLQEMRPNIEQGGHVKGNRIGRRRRLERHEPTVPADGAFTPGLARSARQIRCSSKPTAATRSVTSSPS